MSLYTKANPSQSLAAPLVVSCVDDPAWCCQSNANQSPLFADEQVLGDENVAPLAKRGVSFLFELDSGVDVPFEVEVIVH
ncbi:MAG: hypothetical protein VR74_01645 [Hyphomonas sp. BRH_c22]|nr:MAG: hypothetical protein VR74_01645 [Hyphomonas sp. BRH_c22]